jgi:hypothetical protein
MSPFGNRAADDFARLLDAAVTGGDAFGGAAIAARLRTAGAGLDAAVLPRPEFREALRTRLVAVATVQAAAPPAQVAAPRRLAGAVSWSTSRRGPAVAAGALASVMAFSGIAVAGSQSLPGDPFYGVKRTTETVQLALADDDVERGTRHLDFAATRLREVRGLTLGRDAVDAGPVLGPAAMSGAIRLSSATQPLATGPALSAPVAERVRETLAAMDEQTRQGSELLTSAYRASRTFEPLRALSRFAVRQSAGLEELLPALPPATQSRARASLALISGVAADADDLLGIGTCGAACDPSQTAPTLPAPDAGTSGTPPQDETACACEPAPAPGSAPTIQPTPEPTPQPQPAASDPAPRPSSPPPSRTPSPSPTSSSGGLPLPLPSLPALPLPVPTITVPPLAPLEPLVEAILPGVTGQSAGSAPAPVPAPEPAPAPLPVVVAPAKP